MADELRIESFWAGRFANIRKSQRQMSLKGWSFVEEPVAHFVEPHLSLRTDFTNIAAPIWLVAAPGAVGKSTFARQVAAKTGAIFLDLAVATSVAGNYLSGGIAKNGLSPAWAADETTVLIDSLDEARLRVTPASFADFLGDVAASASQKHIPVVFFGRVGIIEEAWAILTDCGINCPIFDVQFFDKQQSQDLVFQLLRSTSRDLRKARFATSFLSHGANYVSAANMFLDHLREAVNLDGDRFAGYAPVLQAVASVLAEETNPSRLDEVVLLAKQATVLKELCDQILQRESGKLREALKDRIDERKLSRLYEPEEQMKRLAARVLEGPPPAQQVALTPEETSAYEEAVTSFFDAHPFLDGTGKNPSGAVFAAFILARALSQPEYESKARLFSSGGLHTPNPFLINFVLRADSKPLQDQVIPPEHVALLYDSLRAGTKSGDIVSLQIDAGDEEQADGELSITSDGRSTVYEFNTSQAGTMQFSRVMSGVTIQAPQMDIQFGLGESFEMAAPVYLNVGRLIFEARELIVSKEQASASDDLSVVLECATEARSQLKSTPLVRPGVEFSVSWPNSEQYPWSSFSVTTSDENESETEKGLRRLRRLVLAFRSHSKGRLARLQAKIEHSRMTKGILGVRIREALIHDGVLVLEGKMYYLDPKRLGTVVGTSFLDIKMKRYDAKTISYIQALIPVN